MSFKFNCPECDEVVETEDRSQKFIIDKFLECLENDFNGSWGAADAYRLLHKFRSIDIELEERGLDE